MWHEMAKCNCCDQIIKPFEISSEFFMPVCPKCGCKRDISKVVARYRWYGIWYKPWTWRDYRWEDWLSIKT